MGMRMMRSVMVVMVTAFVAVVAAGWIGVEFQGSCQKSLYGLIGTSGDTAIQLNGGLGQSLSGTVSDTAGNDRMDAERR